MAPPRAAPAGAASSSAAREVASFIGCPLAAARLAGTERTRHVEEIHGEFLAIDEALHRLETGDLCLILIDQVEEALEHIARRIAEN